MLNSLSAAHHRVFTGRECLFLYKSNSGGSTTSGCNQRLMRSNLNSFKTLSNRVDEEITVRFNELSYG